MPVTARQAIITAATEAGLKVNEGRVLRDMVRVGFGENTNWVEVYFDRAGRVAGGIRQDGGDTRRYITGTDRRGQVLALIAEAAAELAPVPHIFHNGPDGNCGVARCGLPREGHPLPATDRPEVPTRVVRADEVRPGMVLVADRRSAAGNTVDVTVTRVRSTPGDTSTVIFDGFEEKGRAHSHRVIRIALVVVLDECLDAECLRGPDGSCDHDLALLAALPVNTGACPECGGVHGHASFCSRAPRVLIEETEALLKEIEIQQIVRSFDAEEAFADVERSAESANALDQGGASGLAQLDAQRAAEIAPITATEVEYERMLDRGAVVALQLRTTLPSRTDVGTTLPTGQVSLPPVRVTRYVTAELGTSYALDLKPLPGAEEDGVTDPGRWQRLGHLTADELAAVGRLARAELGDDATDPHTSRPVPALPTITVL